MVAITLIDDGKTRYTLSYNHNILGRMYDNISETISVVKPTVEVTANRKCTMIITRGDCFINKTIDQIEVGSEPVEIPNTWSEYERVYIGFSFSDDTGYIKNSEFKEFKFLEALKPDSWVPSEPAIQVRFNQLFEHAFCDVGYRTGTTNVLEFKNVYGDIVDSIELPFQIQSDLAVSDDEDPAYVKNKSTKYLENEGNDGSSPYATEQYVNVNGGKIDKIYLNNDLQPINNKEVHLDVNKNTVGLSNVDNTSDMNKPVSTATQNAIANVQESIGNGIIVINQGGTTKGTFSLNQKTNLTINLDEPVSSDDYDLLDNKPSINGITLQGNKSADDLGLATSSQGEKADTALQLSDVDASLNTNSVKPVQNKVIAKLIPTQASENNKLADEEFVNSSIASSTANFIGTFENITALRNYSGTVTPNDYAFVINQVLPIDFDSYVSLNNYDKTVLTNKDYAWVINGTKFDLYVFDIISQTWSLELSNTTKEETTLNTVYNRYKAIVNSGIYWKFEYTLNNSSFTASQWASINSGMNSADKSKLDGIENGAQVNTVNSVNNKTGNVVLNASDVGALPDDTVIPTVNNSTITITQGGITKGSFTLNQNNNETIELDEGGSGASSFDQLSGSPYDNTNLANALNSKQDTINDLSTIRSGASAGATAVQPNANISVFVNDAGFITASVNNLTNYYLKSETYTQAEVNALIGAIKTIKYEIVAELPSASATTYFNDSKTIYLVAITGAGNDYYNEYITVRSGTEGSYTYAWEKIGNTQIDLSGYVQKTTTIAGIDLQDNITASELETALIDDSSITENASNQIQAVGVIGTNGLISADTIDTGLTIQIYEEND